MQYNDNMLEDGIIIKPTVNDLNFIKQIQEGI